VVKLDYRITKKDRKMRREYKIVYQSVNGYTGRKSLTVKEHTPVDALIEAINNNSIYLVFSVEEVKK
tara:strand:- start:613 stop:813 length:201 start_codon:yes stop_codon:yes gene_type:complete